MSSVGMNTACSVCAPAVNELVLVDAVPPESVTGDPMSVKPSLNWTEPAAEGLTVASSVTDVPVSCGPDGVTLKVVVVAV